MTPAPKERSEMTPEELEKERQYQEEWFKDLTEHLPEYPIPAKRLTLWERLNRTVEWTLGGFVKWFLVVVLLSIIVKLLFVLVGV